jgi:hypothetical protein
MQKVQHYMTINEVRALNGLEPLEKGGDIVLNQTYITGMSLGDMGDMGADFEEEEGAETAQEGFEETEQQEDGGAGFEETEQQDEGEGADFEETEQQGERTNPFEDTFKARRVHVSVEL